MKILLVDDHAVVRQGYASLLTMMLIDVTVYEAETPQQAMQILAKTPVDIAILDINLEQVSGLQLAPRLLLRWPKLKIIFFSMFDDPSVVNRAMQSGANGYITKRSPPETMVEAIKAVSNGKTYIEHKLANDLARYTYQDCKDPCDRLTQREFEIFISVAKGLRRAKIAADLSISDKTVSNAITQLKSKLHVETSTELVLLAIEKGYVKVAI